MSGRELFEHPSGHGLQSQVRAARHITHGRCRIGPLPTCCGLGPNSPEILILENVAALAHGAKDGSGSGLDALRSCYGRSVASSSTHGNF